MQLLKSESWLMLSEREIIMDTTRMGSGLTEYHNRMRPMRVAGVIEIMSIPPKKIMPNDRYVCRHKNLRITHKMPMGVCTQIVAHHEMMKDDPERLTTEFIRKMIKRE